MSSLMQQLARYPRHIRYPSEIVDHLNGTMRAIFMGYAEDPYKLRSRDIKDWFVMRVSSEQTTLTGEKMVVEYGDVKMADGYGFGAVRVFHENKTYFFSTNHLANLVPLDMLFANLNTLGASVWADTEAGLSTLPAFGNYYQLEEAGNVCEKPSYAEITGIATQGIKTLAELVANSYRFRYSATTATWEPVLDQQQLLVRLRTPYYLVLRDNMVPAAEEHLLAASASDLVLAAAYAPLGEPLYNLAKALTTPGDIGQKGQAVMQDPLFGFKVK